MHITLVYAPVGMFLAKIHVCVEAPDNARMAQILKEYHIAKVAIYHSFHATNDGTTEKFIPLDEVTFKNEAMYAPLASHVPKMEEALQNLSFD